MLEEGKYLYLLNSVGIIQLTMLVLQQAKTKENIPAALKVYEQIRKPRSDQVVALTHQQRHWNHLEDGKEQEDRDKLIAESGVRSPDMPSAWVNSKLWSCKPT